MAFEEIRLSEVKSVCKRDCPDRSWDCHKHCERYKEYRLECDKALEKRLQESQFKAEVDGAVYKAIKRLPGKRSI